MNLTQNLTINNKEMLEHAKKELVMDEAFIKAIMSAEGYRPFDEGGYRIGRIEDNDFFRNKFSCHWQLKSFSETSEKKAHLVTGFGPTNSPTGGTLSVILRALLFDKYSNIDSTIIISNLGAFNSRNISLAKIQSLTPRFIEFIRLLGYKGEIRTHDNRDMLVVSSFTSKVTQIADYLKNQEATSKLYQGMGIQGNDFGTYLDMNFTVADILVPVIRDEKQRVLVFVGIEEYYFPKLAQIVINRLNQKYGTLFAPADVKISAIFSKLINGLKGYPKMSKSIPESSINLDDTESVVKSKIMECNKNDERIILQMIELVSDWNTAKIKEAEVAYNDRTVAWIKIKKEYLEYYLNIKKQWEKTKPKHQIHFELKEGFFNHNEKNR